MKNSHFAIISDIHGSVSILKKALKKLKNKEIDTTIVCGDIGKTEVLDMLKKQDQIHFHLVFGNADSQKNKLMAIAEQSSNLTIHGDIMKLSLPHNNEIYRVAASHYPHVAKKMCLNGQFAVCCHGHTHLKNHQIINNCHLICPGNLCGRKENPGYAIFNVVKEKVSFYPV